MFFNIFNSPKTKAPELSAHEKFLKETSHLDVFALEYLWLTSVDQEFDKIISREIMERTNFGFDNKNYRSFLSVDFPNVISQNLLDQSLKEVKNCSNAYNNFVGIFLINCRNLTFEEGNSLFKIIEYCLERLANYLPLKDWECLDRWIKWRVNPSKMDCITSIQGEKILKRFKEVYQEVIDRK